MKRLLALFLSLVLMLCAAVPAYATGDGNFDGGGGDMGSGTSTNYWNPGMDGVRISVVNVDSHAVVGNTIDWSNQNPSTNMIHFGKVDVLFVLFDRVNQSFVILYSYTEDFYDLHSSDIFYCCRTHFLKRR